VATDADSTDADTIRTGDLGRYDPARRSSAHPPRRKLTARAVDPRPNDTIRSAADGMPIVVGD
jgi:hypothetical protein